jgi:MFS transporter, DHA2 family, multidrug resistance protein
LSASYDQATWIITSFLIANAVVIPISGWLADVVGRKRYYMISVALFTLSSLMCGLSVNLGMLIIARIFQGIGGGGLAPVEQSMMVDTFPPEKRGLAFAAYGVVVIIGPILGPSVGGWITDSYSWHWVFLINVPVGVLSLVLVTFFVDEPPALRRQRERILSRGLRVDFVGFGLIAVALGSLEVTLDRGQRLDWFSSPLITGFALASGLALFALIPWELSREEPILRLDLFTRRNFAIASLFMALMGVIVFGTTQFIPQLLQEVLSYTATNAGLALTMGGLATLFVMPVTGYLTGKVDPRYLIGFALAIQAFALWNMSTLNTSMSFHDAAVARLIQSVGLPFLFVPITNAAYVGLRPQDSNQASALLNVARNLGGTIGISFAQTMLAQRSQIHQARYVETLNPLNPNYRTGINDIVHTLVNQGLPETQAMRAAANLVYRRLLQQAAMLSYIEIFHILMIVVICVVPLTLIMERPEKRGGGGAGGAA